MEDEIKEAEIIETEKNNQKLEENGDKKGRFRFKLKVFLIWLFLNPWTEKITLPNLSTIIWILIGVFFILKKEILLLISIIVGIIFYGIKEWKSGKFIYWYNQRRYKKRNEALKKVREEKKQRFINEINN
ncbi:hypothetical protein CCP1ISM_60023 [Azospirillaceae bacterium]